MLEHTIEVMNFQVQSQSLGWISVCRIEVSAPHHFLSDPFFTIRSLPHTVQKLHPKLLPENHKLVKLNASAFFLASVYKNTLKLIQPSAPHSDNRRHK